MTDQPPPGNYPPPPPPPGGYPPPPPPQGGGYLPPPPPGGGYAPLPPQAGYGQAPVGPAPGALPAEAYTPWLTRVLAWLIDVIPVVILEGIGWGLLLGTRETACITDTSEYDLGEFCASGASTLGQLSIALTGILAIAYWVWNLGYRQGTTGSSIGKSIMKFKIVSEKTWQPIGFGISLVREIIYWVGAGLCFGVLWLVAVLFPLWDPKRQTLVDKIFSNVAVPL
jgi:RDD family protein